MGFFFDYSLSKLFFLWGFKGEKEEEGTEIGFVEEVKVEFGVYFVIEFFFLEGKCRLKYILYILGIYSLFF